MKILPLLVTDRCAVDGLEEKLPNDIGTGLYSYKIAAGQGKESHWTEGRK